MKFFTLVLLPENNAKQDDLFIEHYVAAQMQPHKMTESNSASTSTSGQWDYYCLYQQAELAEMGINIRQYPDRHPASDYLVCSLASITTEQLPFAVLTPAGKWLTSDPLQQQHNWSQQALENIRASGALYGVYVFCHS